ncbi:putative MHC class II antigen protein [Naja naja]|nr:putative MHC class II antigen protein [Naja naja]
MGPGVPPDGLPPLAAHFLAQWKFECLFLNGMQRVRFLYRYIYDRQEIVLFDSDLGKHVAVTALGEADADYWNRNEQILQYQKACVDRFCRLGYEVGNYEAAKREERAIGRRSESWGGRGSSSLGGEAGTPLSFPGLHWGFSSRVTVQPPSSFCPLRATESPSSPQDPNSPPVRDLGSL